MADSGQEAVRMVVLCDRRLAREALAAYFASRRGFLVIGHTATMEGLDRLCVLMRPEVALVDIDQFGPRAMRALRDIHREHPGLGLVVIYTSLSPAMLAEATRSGIVSLVPGSSGLEGIAQLLRRQVNTAGGDPPASGDGRALTDRERAIMSLMSSGHSTADIGRLLLISPHTVDNHKRRIYAKLGVGNQTLAVARAMALGIVPSPWVASETRPRYSTMPDLTAREQDVLRHIAQGHTTRQSARALGIAPKTVENTQARLYRKLGTHNRVETLAVAYRLGLIGPTPT
jgi:DNA-binding NarL/FixJ family response regulator